MTSKNKARGNQFEREVVKLAEKYGYKAKRAYASNGLSLGLTEDVDVLIGKDFKIQCKRRKAFPAWFCAEELESDNSNFDAVVIRRERSKPLIIMDFEAFLKEYYSE